MKTLEGITPEGIVSDFGIGDYINEHLSKIVDNFNKNKVWGNYDRIKVFGNSLIQAGSDTETFRAAMEKYRASFGSDISPDAFSQPLINYVKEQALKSGLAIIE